MGMVLRYSGAKKAHQQVRSQREVIPCHVHMRCIMLPNPPGA